MSRASQQRRRRLWDRKQHQKKRMVYATCALCSRLLAAKTDAVLRARLTEHYTEKHPGVEVIAAPPTPVAQSQPSQTTQAKE